MIKFCTFALISCFVFISFSQQSFAQQKSSLSDCKKWFKNAVADLKKDKKSFVDKYCKLPFLTGSGGDAYYSYNTIENQSTMLESIDEIFACSNKLNNQKHLTFKQFNATEASLSFLSNSFEFNERDENGNKVNPDVKPPYDGLITMGETFYTVSYECGEKHPSYDSSPVYELYVIFDKKSQSFRFWAATSGF